jgi:hypothetical protein
MSPFTNMQHEQSTSAPRFDALPPITEHRTSEHIQIAVTALELWISEHIQTSNTGLLAQLQFEGSKYVLVGASKKLPCKYQCTLYPRKYNPDE